MPTLKLKKIGIDTYKENVVYMPRYCEICRSQGFQALSKIKVHWKNKSLLATLNMTENGLLGSGEIGLSHIAFERLGAPEGAEISISHPNPLQSTDYIREKLDGKIFNKAELREIIHDILSFRYSNIELTAFVTACTMERLTEAEILSLTEAMVETGETIDWEQPLVLDKHCIGGIPGNRTTMIVVPIIAAHGLPIPKTSSRAITSPAGTADTMESLCNVSLSLNEMKEMVAREHACIAWGGALALAPVDDILISVERALNIDSEGQMVASILSKKKAAGSTHVLLDIPIGPTAKVKSLHYARRLKLLFEKIGRKIGLKIKVVFTQGIEPIGNGIGPSLEAEDVLKVLNLDPSAPEDLQKKSLLLAGELFELSGKVKKGKGLPLAKDLLFSREALHKFNAILKSQGNTKTLTRAAHTHDFPSPQTGKVTRIHNLKIAKVAKLAGAPQDHRAGVLLHHKTGSLIKKGEALFTIYAETSEELHFASQYAYENPDLYLIR